MTRTMVMTRGGEIVGFDGLESVMEAMLDRMDAPDEVHAMTSLFLEENFSEEQMKQMIGQDAPAMSMSMAMETTTSGQLHRAQ